MCGASCFRLRINSAIKRKRALLYVSIYIHVAYYAHDDIFRLAYKGTTGIAFILVLELQSW